MIKIFDLEEIKTNLNIQKVIALQEERFILATNNKVKTPLPAYIKDDEYQGDYHIKYGFVERDLYFFTKIAGGPFSLPISGSIHVIERSSGVLKYIFHDEGYLTSLRTAVAGLICAKYLSSKEIKAIGILGTGTQACNLSCCNIL